MPYTAPSRVLASKSALCLVRRPSDWPHDLAPSVSQRWPVPDKQVAEDSHWLEGKGSGYKDGESRAQRCSEEVEEVVVPDTACNCVTRSGRYRIMYCEAQGMG